MVSLVPNSPVLQTLLAPLLGALSSSAQSWLELTLTDRGLLSSRQRLRTAFTQLPRKLGSAAESRVPDEPMCFAYVDLARLALVLAALELQPSTEHVATVEELYRTGEQREQESVLRTLALLPDPARFTELAVGACRTNSVAVFSAIANDNPFPAQHFPELSFNQLVLKAIFIGVPVARITGLSNRVNGELRRMLEEYASERRAAGRAVPDDVSVALALCER